MQVLKFQAQLSQLKRIDFLAGTEFIVGKNIELTLTALPLVPITLLCRGLFVLNCCSRREVVVHLFLIGGIVDHHYLNFIFMIYHLKIVNIAYF